MPKVFTEGEKKKRIEDVIRQYKLTPNAQIASTILGISASTIKDTLRSLKREGKWDFTKVKEEERKKHKDENREKSLKREKEYVQKHNEIRRESTAFRHLEIEHEKVVKELAAIKIINESSENVKVPNWCVSKHSGSGSTGVPTLFLSDLHWAEVVDPAQINNCNSYNLSIANKRLRTVVETCINLCKTHIAKADYPGIVVPLGGDIFSGNIHEELAETNELPIMPAFMDVFSALIWAITTLADEFGKVFIPVVVGNHSRTTKKSRCKEAPHTNFDWLLGKQLEMYFKNDKRVTFRVSESLDTQYRIYSTEYNLTHGDQFNGGSGIAGILSPLMLGDHRKRKRQMAIGQPYDYMLCGHWHSLFYGRGLIINGSLKGYDEYAYRMNFQFEHPGQALWITHPQHDITYWMPCIIRDQLKPVNDWISIPK